MNAKFSYQCEYCRLRLRPGDFMAVIGRTPKDNLLIPVGRADVILRKVGEMYCEECFKKKLTGKNSAPFVRPK